MDDSKKPQPFEIKVVPGWDKHGVQEDQSLDYRDMETFIALPAFAHRVSASWASSQSGFNDEFQYVEFITYFNNVPNMIRIPYAIVMSWAKDIAAASEGNPNWAPPVEEGGSDGAD